MRAQWGPMCLTDACEMNPTGESYSFFAARTTSVALSEALCAKLRSRLIGARRDPHSPAQGSAHYRRHITTSLSRASKCVHLGACIWDNASAHAAEMQGWRRHVLARHTDAHAHARAWEWPRRGPGPRGSRDLTRRRAAPRRGTRARAGGRAHWTGRRASALDGM